MILGLTAMGANKLDFLADTERYGLGEEIHGVTCRYLREKLDQLFGLFLSHP